MEIERVVVLCAGTFFVVLTLTLGSCSAYQSSLLAKAPDPVALSCAMNADPKVCLTAIRSK